MPLTRVCFVCLGNICRSPTAEGVMRRLVDEAGLSDRFEIESAGTAAYHVGELPDKRSREAARRRGILLESRARQFEANDFLRFDFVLAMDRENLENLQSLSLETEGAGVRAPGAEPSLLRSFDPVAPTHAEVPDPYYGGDRGFDDVLDLCDAACRGLIEHIREKQDRA